MFERISNALSMYIEGVFYSFVSSSIVPAYFRPILLRLRLIGVGRSVYIYRDVLFNGRNIDIGDMCAIGLRSYLDGTGMLTIGERVHFGSSVIVLTGTHKIMPSVFRRDRSQMTKLSTTIGRGCWIGSGAVILPGVEIGEGCVIAAGAVVRTDCKPNGLYAGVPALRVRDLPLN